MSERYLPFDPTTLEALPVPVHILWATVDRAGEVFQWLWALGA
jgi:hypothetical protein